MSPLRRIAVEGGHSSDKVRGLADVATPETERGLCEQADISARELVEVARTVAELVRSRSLSPAAPPTTVATCASTTSSAPSRPAAGRAYVRALGLARGPSGGGAK